MATKASVFWSTSHNYRRTTTSSSQFKFMFIGIVALLLLCNNYFIQTTTAIGTGADASFEYCFQQRQMGSIGSCLGQRALSFLQRFEESPNMTLFDGSLKIVRSDNDVDSGTQSRSIVNFLDLNPTDFRAIFDGMSNVMSARSMKWELDALYPGLQMRVGPYHGMNSVLEFVMDPEQDVEGARKAFYNTESPSVGRALTKSFLLPFLLGFKFNLSLVLPLLIGLLLIVGKKIVFISKLVLLLSGVFGWGVPFASHGLGYGQNHNYGHKPLFQDGFYRKEFQDRDSGRGASTHPSIVEVTEAPYEFDRFYDYERKQKRFDHFTTYEDDFKPRNEDRPIETNFQTSATKRQFGWRPTS